MNFSSKQNVIQASFYEFQIKTSAAVIASQSWTAGRLMAEVGRQDSDVSS